jgi:hypothetical protein
MTHRYNVFIREHQIVRFSIEVETEIDDAEIFAVDELDPDSGSITQSFDFESLSASVGAPIDLSN